MSTLLRDERRSRALSTADLARLLDVHPSSVLRWERRERLPGPDHLTALARTLELDTASVVGFFDAARPPSSANDGLRGHGLRDLRSARNVPVRTLASSLGVLPATVYNWESGRVRIPAAHVPTLATALRTSPTVLVAHLTAATPAPREHATPPLRRLRRRTGLSQEALAERIGTTRHRLGAWERGAQPPLWAVRRLAAVCGVEVAHVARLSGVPAPALLDRRRWSPGDLPRVLRVLREWSGMTQREVAAGCGCDTTSVRGWENGRTVPSPRLRARLEGVFGVPGEALLRAYPDRWEGSGRDAPGFAGR